jgi:hypothetical protein
LISFDNYPAFRATSRLCLYEVQQHSSAKNLSPSALADAAQHFGQNDDMSLGAVTRTK